MPTHQAWVNEFAAELVDATPGYIGFLGDEGHDRVRSAYPAHPDRLVEVKNRYDPTNLLRLDPNIPPSTA
jgi:hypothetical protein